MTSNGLETRYVGDTVYSEMPPGVLHDGKRWLAEQFANRVSVQVDKPLPPTAIIKVGFSDPQEALHLLRSTFSAHEQGRVSGGGWTGRRYAFDLADGTQAEGRLEMTGTVDVDQSGRVRRLDATVTRGTNEKFRTVMEFSDYGAHETVSAPPASEVTHDQPP